MSPWTNKATASCIPAILCISAILGATWCFWHTQSTGYALHEASESHDQTQDESTEYHDRALNDQGHHNHFHKALTSFDEHWRPEYKPDEKLPVQFGLVQVCPFCRNPFWMAVPTTNTMTHYGFAGRNVQDYILENGWWDSEESKVVNAVLANGCEDQRDGALMVDIGMNSGYFSGMALAEGCRVHAFEPTLYQASYVHITAALSGHSQRFRLHQNLISDTSGVEVEYNDWNVAETESHPEKYHRTVTTMRPDDVIKENVLYMKIDIEGHEPYAFRGLTEAFAKYEIHFLLWEHTPDYYSADDLANPPHKLLSDMGYWISDLHYPGPGNYIAIHPNADPKIADIVKTINA